MSNEKLRLVYRDYGIADRFPDGTIEINRHLNAWPELKKAILLHELEHTDEEKVNRHDFIHDINSLHKIKKVDLLRFMILNPKSLVQFLPLYYSKRRGFVFDKNMLITYLVFGVLVSGAIYWGLSL